MPEHWADGDSGYRVEPPNAKKTRGWNDNERPPAKYFNWLFWWILDKIGSLPDSLSVDSIEESTADNGVDIDNLRIKDRAIAAEDWPSFSAYLGSDATAQDLTTATEIVLDTEQFDTNNNFNPATGRFTPTVPGVYSIDAFMSMAVWDAAATSQFWIRKNGSVAAGDFARMLFVPAPTAGSGQASLSAKFQMNGTTDYLSIFATSGSDTSVTISGGGITFMSGCRSA